ncbi:hypothetical protein [Pectobacterium carotovorum]|uniref:hypothetical protein n=1 Tax=Pectobacterium brasiliense TaxID=180957 RepID=UPI000B973332|nr:hypothetical protein [Pectobacterium carotovorum]OYN57463.1 hypothetical protein B7L52_00240 [Pectobacterium carotovorum]
MANNLPLSYEKRQEIESAIKARYLSEEAKVSSVTLTIDKINGGSICGTADIFFNGNGTLFSALFEYSNSVDLVGWKLNITRDWND